jgi:hypothetical protein
MLGSQHTLDFCEERQLLLANWNSAVLRMSRHMCNLHDPTSLPKCEVLFYLRQAEHLSLAASDACVLYCCHVNNHGCSKLQLPPTIQFPHLVWKDSSFSREAASWPRLGTLPDSTRHKSGLIKMR